MLALESDKTYRLTPVAATNGDDGKLYIHVKFTDSSFKAIEEYASRIYNQRKSLGPNTNLSIDFSASGDQGHFDVPTGGDNAKGGPNVRRFQFNFSAIPLEGSASFECFQQKKMNESLAAFGAFARRLVVKAQEDVFDATREKMAAVDEESKKNRAREISTAASNALKHGSRRATSLVGVGGGGGGGGSARPAAVTQATTAASLFDAASLAKRKAAERLSSLTPGSSSSSSNFSNNNKAATPNSTSNTSTSTPQYSLRDRVLYSLAVKPQTEAQLINKFKLSAGENIDLATILKQLCTAPGQGGIYSLRREAFGDVKFEHPLITTHEEKMAIKRNALASSSSGALSSSSSSSSSSSNQQKPQRPPPTEGQQNSTAPKVRRLDSPATQPATQQQHQQRQQDHKNHQQPQQKPKPPPPPAPAAPQQQRQSPNEQQPALTVAAKPRPTPPAAPVNNKLNGRNKQSPSDSILDVDFGLPTSSTITRNNDSKNLNDFGTASSPNIPVIKTREQRSAMKADFMSSYSEYRRLHDSLSAKTAYFRDIRPQLEACEAGSEKYLALEESIRDAYANLQKDESYIAAKRKLDELHETLARIKQAIEEFDVTHGPPPNGRETASAASVTSGSVV